MNSYSVFIFLKDKRIKIISIKLVWFRSNITWDVILILKQKILVSLWFNICNIKINKKESTLLNMNSSHWLYFVIRIFNES